MQKRRSCSQPDLWCRTYLWGQVTRVITIILRCCSLRKEGDGLFGCRGWCNEDLLSFFHTRSFTACDYESICTATLPQPHIFSRLSFTRAKNQPAGGVGGVQRLIFFSFEAESLTLACTPCKLIETKLTMRHAMHFTTSLWVCGAHPLATRFINASLSLRSLQAKLQPKPNPREH